MKSAYATMSDKGLKKSDWNSDIQFSSVEALMISDPMIADRAMIFLFAARRARFVTTVRCDSPC